MERLNERLFQHVHGQDPTSMLLGPAGSARFAPDGARVAELPPGPLPLTLVASVLRGVALARRARPRVVLAGSGLMAPAAVAAARAASALPAVYLHGLDIVAPSRLYRMAWWPAIRSCRGVLVNSANTRRLAIGAGVAEDRIRIVHPGTDLPVRDTAARGRFRQRRQLDDDVPVLLSVGRLTTRKGLAEFVSHALPAIIETWPRARLVIIGDQAQDALHRGSGAGFERIREAAEAAGVSSAIDWAGPCSEAELADAYEGADVHVFPVRQIPGDVEGFGMVAIEAAAHGLPTVAFDVGGVADAVVDGRNGCLVAAGDYPAFAAAVADVLSASRSGSGQGERARDFAGGFSWDRFGREVLEALEAVS